jgi:prepilin-type N-terminal cleavage/methylation domain-containing protein
MKGGQEKMKTAPCNKQVGFTLLEILVALSIFLVLFLGTSVSIITSLYLGSVIKHKVQAMYWAQRFIEEERRLPFSTLASLPSASVSLDTNGTFNTTADDRTGNRVVTVTNIDANRKRLKIEINWTEKFLRGTNTMREYYSTDIAQESQLN